MRALGAVLLCALAVSACSDRHPPAAVASSANAPFASSDTPPSATAVPVDERSARLQAVVDDFATAQSVPFSVVVLDLATGAGAQRLSDRRLPSASLYKLFVARELLRRIDAGELSGDRAAGDGNGRTVDQCVHDMIVVSDNDCGVAGLQLVGRGALDPRLHADGFTATSLAAPQQTSADDVTRLLLEVRDDTAHPRLYELLQEQEVNDRLPQGLPPGTPIAHKTGDVRHYAHDAGVITTPSGDVLLVVLTGPWPLPCCDADHPGEPERLAFGAIARLGRAVYDAIA